MEDQWPICFETNGRSMAYLFRNQWKINGLSDWKPMENLSFRYSKCSAHNHTLLKNLVLGIKILVSENLSFELC